jgi:hypothetical protein
VLDGLSGRVELKWREPRRVGLDLAGGTLEMESGVVRFEGERLDLVLGEARWVPRGGPPVGVSAGTSFDPAKGP